MPVPVKMPNVNEAAAEVTIGVWLRQPGDAVAEGEPLLEVVSDKVTIEVPAPTSGTLVSIAANEGDTVAAGALIATIAPAGEAGAPPDQSVTAGASASLRSLSPPILPPAGDLAVTAAPTPISAPPPPQWAANLVDINSWDMSLIGVATGLARRLITPRAAAIAAAYHLTDSDLAALPGSGLGGRLNAADVQAAVGARPAPADVPPMNHPSPVAASPPLPVPPVLDLMPLTPVRRAIAAHMERSVATAPHGWMSIEIDMSAVVRARAALRGAFEADEGFSLTYLPYFAVAVVRALAATPDLNATWQEGELRQHHTVNLGVAVAIDAGLVVPVIVGADGLNLTGMARALQTHVERARANRLAPSDMAGGTMTINNTGAVGSVLSRPIINQPQVAIVTMEAITRRPVVVGNEDAIAVRPLMNACLAYDERAADTTAAGRFLSAIRAALEDWA
ncbi:MAG: 2-oxo acid dehydrogenase subunit E2 [Chloroflexi bacterium]|nr:2-oxo acid dehydrogenase subunit E2 [Chloroflexota bacterium]